MAGSPSCALGAGIACRWPFQVGCAIDQISALVFRLSDLSAPLEKAMSASPAPPIEVFISYSHNKKDAALREKLGNPPRPAQAPRHHRSMARSADRRRREWAGAIDEHLNSAAVILLLVSPDFVASDYCYDLEMTRALERHDAGDARVIPVILRTTLLGGRSVRASAGAAGERPGDHRVGEQGQGVHGRGARHPQSGPGNPGSPGRRPKGRRRTHPASAADLERASPSQSALHRPRRPARRAAP